MIKNMETWSRVPNTFTTLESVRRYKKSWTEKDDHGFKKCPGNNIDGYEKQFMSSKNVHVLKEMADD